MSSRLFTRNKRENKILKIGRNKREIKKAVQKKR